MNKKLAVILAFGAGAAAGFFASLQYNKNKYAKIADEEIAEVKARYLHEYGEPEVEITVETETEDKEKSIKEYAAEISKMGYRNYSDGVAEETQTPVKEETTTSNSYIVDPTDQDDNYDICTLNYFADGVLTYLTDEVIDDPITLIGIDVHELFADGDEDAMYVRNPDSLIEYEILYDPRKYSEVKKPSGSR